MSVQWELRVHPEAAAELRAMKQNDPAAFEEIEEVLNYLADEPDPRQPRHPRLNVCHLYRDAPGWYRVRSFRLNLRVVYRVLETRAGRAIELKTFHKVHNEASGHTIQVMQAQPRALAYGRELRQRRKKIA